MELGLSLGDPSKPFKFFSKDRQLSSAAAASATTKKSLGFCMALGINCNDTDKEEQAGDHNTKDGRGLDDDDDDGYDRVSAEIKPIRRPPANDKDDQTAPIQPPHPVVQLDLLPLVPVSRQAPFPLSSDNGSSGSSGNVGMAAARVFDVNRLPSAGEVSSPNSAGSSFQMDFSVLRGGNFGVGRGSKRDSEAAGNNDGAAEAERASSRASDEDENGLTRKKLRLSKEQSAYLEESFKEHNTLNPKQKLALAKQLNLRPRQVEVWFQNRRARTKLKQTEVDCEYLKRCCEKLTEENRRLHKELQELRALKTSNPFYMQLPATTLTMCPSCERVATTSTAPPNTTTATTTTATTTTDPDLKAGIPFPLTRPRFYPFSHSPTNPHQPAAS